MWYRCTSLLPVPGGGQAVSDRSLLAPVSPSRTLRQTVEYAVQMVLEADGDTPATVRFVYLQPTESSADTAESDGGGELLERVSVWAREDAGDAELTVETARLGDDRYIFSPSDAAEALAGDARASGISRVVLDPEYDPGIGAPLVRPLERELAGFEGIDAETAPVTATTQRTPLLEGTSLTEIGALFVVSFGFYQLLAGNFTWLAASPASWAAEIYWLDVVTGTISASVAAVGLSQLVLSGDPTRRTLGRLLRGLVFVPYLLVEIVKANVAIAAVILDPRLPVEPQLVSVRPALWGGVPITVLANSITLTPGTLSVRVTGRSLLVHTLVPAAKEDLVDGGLERAVRFVFYGRGAMRLPTLRERGEAEPVPADHVRPDGGSVSDEGNSTDEDTDQTRGDGR
jgi:multicomponent Na+:H+ antiporter subunit E